MLLILAVLANGMRATPGWLNVLAILGVLGALLATRNVPIAGLVTMPTLILGLSDRLPARATPPASVQTGRRMMEIGLATTVLVATAIILPRLPAVAGDEVIPRSFPVAAVDRLADLQPNARVFAEYGWGGYVIYRLYDEGARVFVDGRNDMYDEPILEAFVAIRNAEPGWEAILERYGGVDAILVPPAAALARAGSASREWCVAHADEVATLLLRDCP